MKQALRKNLEPVLSSFIVKTLTEPHFDPNWHFHPHYQLFLVEEGTGTRFIGDSIKPFSPGDFVFLGPNLPHLWRSDQVYFNRQGDNRQVPLVAKGIVIYFSEDFLGESFFQKQEMGAIQQLLFNAQQGLEWTGNTRSQAEERLKSMVHEPVGFSRIILLLTLLDMLSHAADYRFLTSSGYINTVKPTETDRMRTVHDYVLNHFAEDLSLDTVADLAGLSAPAFCRYFKARANKTFSEFIAEIRVGHACKLLINSQLNITQVSLESGFRTLSNFNRQFKEITGQTPSVYVKTYRQI